MRRPDETPTLEVIANVLSAITFGLAMKLLGDLIRTGGVAIDHANNDLLN